MKHWLLGIAFVAIVAGGYLLIKHDDGRIQMPVVTDKTVDRTTTPDPSYGPYPTKDGWDGFGEYRTVFYEWDIGKYSKFTEWVPTDRTGSVLKGYEGCYEEAAVMHTLPKICTEDEIMQNSIPSR